MEQLNELEYKMIEEYKKSKKIEIANYFFNKFEPDLSNVIFYKINSKFSSVPFEKGDLFSFIWKGVKITLENYKNGDKFDQMLISNCYITTLKEVKKFITNGQLVLNQCFSLDKYTQERALTLNKNTVTYINNDENLVLQNIIETACEYAKNYTPKFVKNVIYLKSMGFSVSEICKKLKVTRHFVDELLKSIESLMRKSFGL